MLLSTTFIQDYLTIIIIYYLVLLTPSVSAVIKCQFEWLNKQPFLKTIFSFIILYFVIIIKDKNLEYSPLQKLFICIPLFIIIKIISRIEPTLIFSIIFILLISYFLILSREYFNIPGNENKYWISFTYPKPVNLFQFKPYQNYVIHSIVIILFIICFLIFLFGVVAYYGKLAYLKPKTQHNIMAYFRNDNFICKEVKNKNYIDYFNKGLKTISNYILK